MCRNNFFVQGFRFLVNGSFLTVFLLFFSFLITFTSCEDPSFVGLEVQPPGDRFVVNSYRDEMVNTSVWEMDSVPALNHSFSLLGAMDDPQFGRLNASFMTQIRTWNPIDFGSDRVADSLILYLIYSGPYGGNYGQQEITVYEITEHIDDRISYFSNFDAEEIIYEPDVLAAHTINPAEGDTLIAIPITSTRFQDKLLFAPDTATLSVAHFLEYFKGVYVKADLVDGDGSIFSVNLNHTGSKLSLYYRNDTPDTSFRYDFVINQGIPRVNLFEHDYSEAVFHDVLSQTGTDDSLYYVQGTAGVMGRLDFDFLHAWRDSMPVSINMARLYLPVDQTAIDEKYPLPNRIALLEKDEEGRLFGTIDLSLGDQYFGGTYNSEEGYYAMNVTNWVQAFVRGKRTDKSLYVSTRESGTTPNRVVLRNRKHSLGGARLEITYTKH
jgi:hypothetical protein